MKSLLIPALALGLSAGAAQAQEKKVLELPADCGALLNQEVQGKVLDIIHCPRGNFGNTMGSLAATYVTYGDFTQEIGYLTFPELGIDQEATLSENGISIIVGRKVDDLGRVFFYTSMNTQVQFLLSRGYDCYSSEESETGSIQEICYTDTSNEFGIGENGDVIFPFSDVGQISLEDGERIGFGIEGVITYSPKDGKRL